MTRYAFYYVPDRGSALSEFGCRWLGRNHFSGQPVTPLVPAGITPEERSALTASPARYGFHGTLKPPFRLAKGKKVFELVDVARRFAATRRAFSLPLLRLAVLGNFLALVPSEPSDKISALARDCVTAFDEFRADPTEREIERRMAVNLSDRQQAYIHEWGYPYVMDEFRFHLTLTGKLDEAQRKRVETALAQEVAPLCEAPVSVHSIHLCAQTDEESPFTVLEAFEFAET